MVYLKTRLHKKNPLKLVSVTNNDFSFMPGLTTSQWGECVDNVWGKCIYLSDIRQLQDVRENIEAWGLQQRADSLGQC